MTSQDEFEQEESRSELYVRVLDEGLERILTEPTNPPSKLQASKVMTETVARKSRRHNAASSSDQIDKIP